MMGCGFFGLIFMYDAALRQSFIDSCCSIPMRLGKTALALNLSTVENFPHRFNKQENDYYHGPYPDKHYYGDETMSDKDKVKFEQVVQQSR